VLAPENVGEIANRGWELAASTAWSRLTATGALSFVDSRVRQLAPGYAGDLRTGDRALEVPARTASITAAWSASRWHASLGGSRAFDWINYDELALSKFLIGINQQRGEPTGEVLRAFWRRYDGGFRLRATASRDISTGLALDISGENLLNHQRGEPDNITVVPGRTILTGLRLKF
jgi:iron complex outermembrane recepter protein